MKGPATGRHKDGKSRSRGRECANWSEESTEEMKCDKNWKTKEREKLNEI